MCSAFKEEQYFSGTVNYMLRLSSGLLSRSKKVSFCNNLAASIERQHFLKIKAEVSVSVLNPTSGLQPPFMVSLMLF
jgi:hypothetical protein